MGKYNPASTNIKSRTTRYGTSQGYFIPINPEKYLGDLNMIGYHSSWEKDFMHTCDENPAILQWAAEPFSIPYMCPLTGQRKNYWPDFLICYMDKTGNLMKEVIEIKPIKQSLIEKAKSRKDKEALAVNQAKWQATTAFCRSNGLKFRIMTEAQLYGKK